MELSDRHAGHPPSAGSSQGRPEAQHGSRAHALISSYNCAIGMALAGDGAVGSC